MNDMDNGQLMELLQLSGRLIMENGGEIYRVQETVNRMGQAAGFAQVDCFAVPSGFFIGWKAPDGTSETGMVRVRRSGTCLWRVNEVNAVSRAMAAGELSPQEALTRLQTIRDARPPYSPALCALAAALCGASFTLMFGGTPMDGLVSALCAALAGIICHLAQRNVDRPLMVVLLGSFLTGLFAGLAGRLVTLTPDVVVAGALMPYLPGLAMTKAVADLIRGDMLSGISHGFSALLTAGMIALGTILSTAVLGLMGGGL